MLYREIVAVCSQIQTKHINMAVWAEGRIAECQVCWLLHIPLDFKEQNKCKITK